MSDTPIRPGAPDVADPHRKQPVEPSTTTLDFNVEALEDVTINGPPALMERDLMSPYVWDDGDGRLGIMVRAVTRPDAPKTDTGMIWAGWSTDGGRSFEIGRAHV